MFFLGIIQACNYLLPLITFPYLIRVLGTEIFGLLSFAIAFITYFQITVDYGFHLSATREVPLVGNDSRRLSTLFFSVLAVKAALAAVCAIVLMGILVVYSPFHSNAHLYLVLFAGVIGSILFPAWLFQGKEEMGFITFFGLLSKSITTALVFIVIKTSDHYIRYAYLNSCTIWVIGITAFIVALKRYHLQPLLITGASFLHCLKGGWEIFISQASVSLFTNTNTFVLGLFTNNRIVGTYAIADKIVRAVIYLCAPVCNAVYPKTSLLFSESRTTALAYLRKFLIGGSLVFGALSICLFLCADLLVVLFSGSQNGEITLLIRIMSFLPLSVFIDNVFGTQIMLNINQQKQFMRIILSGGICSLVVLVLLVPRIHALGAAIAFDISALVIVVSMIVSVRKAGIRLLRNPDAEKKQGE